MNISEVIEQIKQKSQAKQIAKDSCDQVIIGDAQQEVKKIVTTFMATADVIQQAKNSGANLIITHEPTWFNGHDTKDWLLHDTIYQAKCRLAEEANVVIWRYHDHMHLAPKDQIYAGLETALSWGSYHLLGNPTSENPLEQAGICYEIPELQLDKLLEQLRQVLGLKVVRFIGEPTSTVHRVGLLLGGSSLGLGDERNPMKLIAAQQLDTVICGDITEWTLPAYVRDANMLGIKKNMIILGHEKSEEMGMKYLVPWLQTFLPCSIEFIDAQEPFTYFSASGGIQ